MNVGSNDRDRSTLLGTVQVHRYSCPLSDLSDDYANTGTSRQVPRQKAPFLPQLRLTSGVCVLPSGCSTCIRQNTSNHLCNFLKAMRQRIVFDRSAGILTLTRKKRGGGGGLGGVGLWIVAVRNGSFPPYFTQTSSRQYSKPLTHHLNALSGVSTLLQSFRYFTS
jgi:hypothetical protein